MVEASELETVLRSATSALDKLRIAYHVTGGLATSYYGEPRFTQGIDFVIRIDSRELLPLAGELDGEFLLDIESARQAIERKGMFQALHRELVIKTDFHVGESLKGELDRSCRVTLFRGLVVPLVSKEDALLSKLLWIEQGSGKSRHRADGNTTGLHRAVERTSRRGERCRRADRRELSHLNWPTEKRERLSQGAHRPWSRRRRMVTIFGWLSEART